MSADTNQQGAVFVQLGEQNAAVGEQVSGADVAVEVARGGLQPRVQLRVDVELPGIGRFLELQPQGRGAEDLGSSGTRALTPPPLTFSTIFSEVAGLVA